MTKNEKGQFTQNRQDLTGQKFGRLTAIEFSHKNKNVLKIVYYQIMKSI